MQRRLHRYFTLVNIYITGFSYPYDLVILGWWRSSCKMEYTIPWLILVQTLLSLSHIFLESFRSMILKAIWLLMPFLIICYAIPMAIRSYLTFFTQRLGVLCCGRGLVETSSHMLFSISIDLVILDHIGQLMKLMSFSRVALVPPLCNFSVMADIPGWDL